MNVSRPIESLRQTALHRPPGYLEDCLSAGTISADGITVTFSLESYKALVEKYREFRVAKASVDRSQHPAHGPGTELKKLLAKVGIVATPNCSCNARARAMDENEAREPGWCEAHLDEIVGWLREEATRRKLPFLDAAGRLLIRRAIANARHAASG